MGIIYGALKKGHGIRRARCAFLLPYSTDTTGAIKDSEDHKERSAKRAVIAPSSFPFILFFIIFFFHPISLEREPESRVWFVEAGSRRFL